MPRPHRLDELRRAIPQHGCVPAEPASVSPGKDQFIDNTLVSPPMVCATGCRALWRRNWRCCRASSSLRSRSAKTFRSRPSSLSLGGQVADGAVQANGVVVIHITAHQPPRILDREGHPRTDAFGFQRFVPALDPSVALRIKREVFT